MQLSDREVPISISVGVAAHSSDIEKLIASADAAMYEAKRLGKNRTAVEPVGLAAL